MKPRIVGHRSFVNGREIPGNCGSSTYFYTLTDARGLLMYRSFSWRSLVDLVMQASPDKLKRMGIGE